ncbi:MAG: penicillin-binding protein 1C [Magnetospirillum sp. WYHS-4]
MGRKGRIAVLAALAVAGIALLFDRLLPPDLSRLADASRVVTDARGEILRAFGTRSGQYWRLSVQAGSVDSRYRDMLVAFEDKRFFSHPGVDPLAILRALGQWARQGRVISGASTLTMQTARLLEPRPRGLSAKLAEALRAFQLEARFSKDEILSMYLTLAPMGGNLEGVRAASLAYFGKEPGSLTAAEAALLVALPQSPTRRQPQIHPEAARVAAVQVAERLRRDGLLSDFEVEAVRTGPLPSRRSAMPMAAAHLAEHLARNAPGGAAIRTTLDGTLQRRMETLARQQAAAFPDGASLALVVIDNAGGQVKAYLGGSGLAGRAEGIDLARAVRSPGSALKPFVYGMAFDDLMLHPETRIEDGPLRFSDYAPRNFDDGFHGQVTVREALQQSYNLPAIAVLDRLGPSRFLATLRDAGAEFRLPRAIEAPGLPVALGGLGVRLIDLTALYAGIANGGRARAPRRLADDPPAEGRRLMSPVSAWYLTDILADAARPDSLAQLAAQGSRRRIAYKTGTSYGFRDAWAMGWTASHTVGVWVGRADGTPRPGHHGRNTAAPLLFQVFDRLPDGEGLDVVPPPAEALLAATTQDLPPTLRVFRPQGGGGRMPGEQPLRIVFPPDGGVVELPEADGRLDRLPLRAAGGRNPLRWLVNGLPVPTDPHGDAVSWLPDGPGFVRVTVVDAADHSDHVAVRLQ